MRVMISTPAYGGLLTVNYLSSMLDTIARFFQERVEYNVLTIANESLISRARNISATMAMEKGYDKLVFIDSDIGWKWEQLAALLRSDKLVVGGTYPLKQLPLSLNYNVFPEHERLFAQNGVKSYEAHAEFGKLSDPSTREIAVRDIPTGFMVIDTRVLRALREKVAAYTDYRIGLPTQSVSDFFPVRVRDGILESEDWAFCSLCREHGIPVYLNTAVVVSHTGSFVYGG